MQGNGNGAKWKTEETLEKDFLAITDSLTHAQLIQRKHFNQSCKIMCKLNFTKECKCLKMGKEELKYIQGSSVMRKEHNMYRGT